MIERLNHVAVVVADLDAAAGFYRQVLGAEVSAVVTLAAHGVHCVFVELENTKIELLHPVDGDSPVANFLMKHPGGAMHHLCFEVDDINLAKKRMAAAGCRVLGDVAVGAHGKPVLFLHPKDAFGVLIELEEV